jgi:hypothetical protein
MSETLTLPAPPAPPERKCVIEDVFEASFIELLKLVPTNPFVRAWVLKFCGKLPPEDCATFELLKDWVEFNCVKRVRPKPQCRSQSDDGIGILVHFSETEYGRANYSVDRSGEDTFQIGQEELLSLVQEAIDAGGGLTEVVDQIVTRIDDDAWNECDPDMDSYGDYEYDEHDSNDSGNGEINYSREQIQSRVLAFLQNHYPELAQQL